jgi:hypothetical protein
MNDRFLLSFSVDSMESHGSIVTHLLSQVKIGMDLTKVALPTFILERRSLLEMYADYFAHPDQFVRYLIQFYRHDVQRESALSNILDPL